MGNKQNSLIILVLHIIIISLMLHTKSKISNIKKELLACIFIQRKIPMLSNNLQEYQDYMFN